MGFFGDHLEFRLVCEGGLLRFGEPRFPERLKAVEIVRRHGVSGNDGSIERKLRAGVGIELAGDGKIFCFLENRDSGASLRAQRTINRAGRNGAAGQRNLRFKHIVRRARKIGGRLL